MTLTSSNPKKQSRVIVEGLAFTECPRWHGGRLWFSDVLGEAVFAVNIASGQLEKIVSVAAWPTGLGWDHEGRLLVVSMKGRKLLRETVAGSGQFDVFADLSALFAHHCNDMVVDKLGRAYVGGYSFDVLKGEAPRPSEVALVDPDGTIRVVGDGLMMPNGMALLGDGDVLVVAESRASRLAAFDVDRRDGSLSNRRVWAVLAKDDQPVKPYADGICADAEGAVWVASPSTQEFLRVREGGEILDRISSGDRRAIACMLGGAERRTLFMCSTQPLATGGGFQEVAAARLSRIEAVEVTVPGAGLP